MEVIVDDSQLSLAIGKKGQNVRLAAKLLGWKIDIKSEEEKRQEVESAMAALVAPGRAGLAADRLRAGREGGGEPGGGRRGHHREAGRHDAGAARGDSGHREPGAVQQIQEAVNAYYNQFEDTVVAAPGEASLPSAEPASEDMNVAAADLAGFEEVQPEELAREPGSEWGPPEPETR